jgi:uncharacterized protein with ParB-like and HNH nuclease domain
MRSGRIQVPTFQRDFVWKRQDVEKLLDSIRREIPLGTITLWEPGQGHRTELFEPFFKSVKVKKWSGDEENTEQESADDDSNWFFSFTEQTGLQQPREITGPVYGVIDGRQRLTTLMMLFGGITFSSPTHKHGGLWTLKLDSDLVKDDAPFTFLTWKKSREYASVADWVKAGLFPLWLHSKRDDFVDALDNSNNFESQAQHVIARRKWRRNLNMFCDIVSSLNVAAYILDAKVDLEKVCVIFETLNTRGVRVGVYDIVQARLMGMPVPALSTERYDLKRNIHQVYEASGNQYLGRCSTKMMDTAISLSAMQQ